MGYIYLPYATGFKVIGKVYVKNTIVNGSPLWEPVR
ncbi:hypothetical protein DFQ15_101177 [Xylophilus ampelinus]|uniref:Uncharacterized protein n=1 Tax=Xylophilus ampelinus TaxID=54067 RepID=A0A318SLG2_9BURK|nr:hypothetical protein DFQ15_101177 [Xylophilus ampelinus]